MRASVALAVLLPVMATAACGTKVDLSKGLQIVDVSTGWSVAADGDRQHKIVPSITFRLKNTSNQTLSTLQANVLFRRVGEEVEWGSGFVRIAGA